MTIRPRLDLVRRRTACLAIVVVGVLALACDAGPSSPSDPNLSLLLTDAPSDELDEVNIYFTSVTAKPRGRPVEHLILELAVNPVDLLTLADDVIPLAAGEVGAGAYEFIQINVDQDRSHVVERGAEQPLRVPSEEVKVLGGFEVDDDHRTTITLDFDADESLVRLGHGGWLLRPVIVMTGHNTTSR